MRKKLDLAEKLKKISQARDEKPILEAKKIGGLEDEIGKLEDNLERIISKIEHEIESTEVEKIEIKSIKDLEIPMGEIWGISSLGSVCDKSEKRRLDQILLLQDDSKMELKWTVIKDPQAREFGLIVKEGFKQIKGDPPIFGLKIDNSVILSSHSGMYTFTLACYDIEFEKMIKIFISALDYVKKYEI